MSVLKKKKKLDCVGSLLGCSDVNNVFNVNSVRETCKISTHSHNTYTGELETKKTNIGQCIKVNKSVYTYTQTHQTNAIAHTHTK